MTAPTDNLQGLIEAARVEHTPSADDRARVAHALAIKLGAGAAGAAVSHTAVAGKTVAHAAGWTLAAKLMVATLATSAAVGGGLWMQHHHTHTVAPSAAAAHPGLAPAPSVNPVPSVVLPNPTPSALQAQAGYLQGAQRALRDGQPAEALRLLDALSVRYPATALREEQRAARVLALCDLGRIPEARTEAQRLYSESPASPLLPRVRSSCVAP